MLNKPTYGVSDISCPGLVELSLQHDDQGRDEGTREKNYSCRSAAASNHRQSARLHSAAEENVRRPSELEIVVIQA